MHSTSPVCSLPSFADRNLAENFIPGLRLLLRCLQSFCVSPTKSFFISTFSLANTWNNDVAILTPQSVEVMEISCLRKQQN